MPRPSRPALLQPLNRSVINCTEDIQCLYINVQTSSTRIIRILTNINSNNSSNSQVAFVRRGPTIEEVRTT